MRLLGKIREAREFGLEGQRYGAGGAVSLLGDDDFRLATRIVHRLLPLQVFFGAGLWLLVLQVILVAIDEHHHVGVLLDASAQHAGRTGREVLTLGAKTMGLGTDRVDEILDVVGLTPPEAKRRVGDYSLGMRQRLGIGHALLGDPEVLILDEPANGLDPAGIRWMRGLLRSYAERGGTVLLSSHLLHEVEQVADDLVMIGRGRIVRQGTKQELLRGAGTNAASTDDAALASALEAAGIQVQRTQTGIHTTVEPIEVGRVAAQHGIVLVQLGAAGGSGLEEMFLNLTAADSREVAR